MGGGPGGLEWGVVGDTMGTGAIESQVKKATAVGERRSMVGDGGWTGQEGNNAQKMKALVDKMGPDQAAMAVMLGRSGGLRGARDDKHQQGHQREIAMGPDERGAFKRARERIMDCKGKHTSDQTLNNTNKDAITEAMVQNDTTTHTNGTMGLEPPKLNDGDRMVMGCDKKRLRRENKERKWKHKSTQVASTQWKTHEGQQILRQKRMEKELRPYKNAMCPARQAIGHPAATLLRHYAETGCPVRTGKQWTKEMMWEAVERGPHRSALTSQAMEHFANEAREKVEKGQARLIRWDTIKDNPPRELKISPIAAVPHKSKAFRSILDLSFRLRLKNGGVVSSVNDTTEKVAPQGSVDQIGEVLSRIIYAFAEADDDAKIFMAKWDIKDGFWRMDCEEGQEYNFAYVLPQPAGKPIILVVPTSLQMGWVESPPFFCTASETARDVIEEYIETPVSSLPTHKFINHVMTSERVNELPKTGEEQSGFAYMVEVYVDDFMSIVIPVTQDQLEHVATAIMTGIHDVFPADEDNSNDPVSEKKLKQREGEYDVRKTLLGFDFDGINKTMWLEEAKREFLLTILKRWIREADRGQRGIPFAEFRSVTAKIRHAFTSIPQGVALLSTCNRILQAEPRYVYIHRNKRLLQAIKGCRTLLRESFNDPTRCRELTSRWPDFVGVVDASSHGVGGVVFGEGSECIPTVFRWKWPEEISKDVKSVENPSGGITNSDLEMAGMVLAWLVIEGVGGDLTEKTIALFGDNTPSISWINRLASKTSDVAEQLVQALALRLKTNKACPLITTHIEGKKNEIADVPSRSFGSNKEWHCETNTDFHSLFNSLFPLHTQTSWTVFQLNYKVVTRVTSILQRTHFELEEWKRLPQVGNHVGTIGCSSANLWQSIRTCRRQSLDTESVHSWHSQLLYEQDTTGEALRCSVAQSLARSRPLGRRSQWPMVRTQQK